MRKMSGNTGRAWIEVNLNNLSHNVKNLKSAMPKKCELMAVVKAEAYGHGAYVVSRSLNKMGVRAFAVATLEEGIKLRRGGIRGEILILGYTEVLRAYDLKKYSLTQTVIDYGYAEALNRQKIPLKVHVKIDTGMHRLGVGWDEPGKVRKIFSMKYLDATGIFTHLSCSDSLEPGDVSFTQKQIRRFYRCIGHLKNRGIAIPKVHIQSSYGLLNYPNLSCDYVRAGIALYGCFSSPGDKTRLNLDLRPVLSLKAKVVLIREIKKGEPFGYGRNFTAGRDTRIALISIGYGDGYPRSLSWGNGWVKIRGYVLPVIGNICMDSLGVDITDAEGVRPGDTAVLIGQGDVSASSLAGLGGSISNELLCRMGRRLPVVIKMRKNYKRCVEDEKYIDHLSFYEV
ncbi:MAG: serine racemase VanT catalytic subunit [Lachnospiraceae bacterium]|nr:serine racemase VanT catalytic subunit [Lachnospiraceae bacterium]